MVTKVSVSTFERRRQAEGALFDPDNSKKKYELTASGT
jgi:hypothetical protein